MGETWPAGCIAREKSDTNTHHWYFIKTKAVIP